MDGCINHGTLPRGVRGVRQGLESMRQEILVAGEGLGVRKGMGVWVLAQPFPDFVATAAVPESTGAPLSASWPGCLFGQ